MSTRPKKWLKDYYYRCNPYCFQKMPDGRYLGLNRQYLPLDYTRYDVGGHLESSAYEKLLEDAHKRIGVKLSTHDIKILKHSGDENKFWLYGDRSAPWTDKKHEATYDKKRDLVPAFKWLV